MRRLLATTTFALALPGLAHAQAAGPTLLDMLSLDRLMQRVLQSGIMALRTQMDLKYGDMRVDLRTGAVTMTDIKAWPLPEWDEDGTCEVGIERITLRSGAIDEIDRLRLKVRLVGLTFPDSCLPEEPRQGLAMLGTDEITMPWMTFDLDYGVAASDMTLRLYSDIQDVAAIDMTAHAAYIWADGREDMEEPEPVIFLESATLSVENKGAWDAIRPLVPPPFTSDGAGLVVEGAIGQALIDMNRDAAGPDASEDETGLTDAQRAFVKSIASAWPAFLANPETLVLQTSMDTDTFLDFPAMEDDPRVAFDTLLPQLALAPASTARMLPAALLEQAMGDTAALSADDRRRIGTALLTGEGAPRNYGKGMDLMIPLAEEGDGGAAVVIADAFADTMPELAYRWALRAGEARAEGAAARLDRLETVLPFAEVLAIQSDLSGEVSYPGKPPASIAQMRDTALARLSGISMPRSYGHALFWANLAAAAGDPEAAGVLEELDERARLAGQDARDAWAGVEERAAEIALDFWIGADLPARYAK
ncbi:MAG: hypothetical protein QNJ44_11455 [Rhodobacter sp.]|nr:hypothetical protein [Rhodobacter sp.]